MRYEKFSLLVLAFSLVSPLSANSIREIGTVDPGSPANSTDEVSYINTLVQMRNASPDLLTYSADGHDYTLDVGSSVPATLNAVDSFLSKNDSPGSPNNINVTGADYLIVKFGNTTEAYYVSGLTTFSAPNDTGNGNGISHYSLFSAGATPPQGNLPDGGTTIALLGSAMVAMGLLRRKLKA